jgi:putative protease
MDILAPAGSYESLRAAIQAGANSVYFGIDKLNMRSRSSMNFTLADLAEISIICRDNGVKSYITLNTVMYEEDLAVMREIVDAAISHHIDAIIASDQAVINSKRTHASCFGQSGCMLSGMPKRISGERRQGRRAQA